MMITKSAKSPLNCKTTKIEIHGTKLSKLMKQKVHKQTLEISMKNVYQGMIWGSKPVEEKGRKWG